MTWTKDDLARLVELEAHLQGVDPRLARAVAEQESGFDPQARSPKGAYGVMQLMESTAKQLGVNRDDPADNIRGGVMYLKQQQAAFGGDVPKTLAAYNAGPMAVQAHRGVPPYKETQGYVQRILGKLGPASAEAAGLSAAEQSRLQELEAHLARLEGQTAPPPQGDAQATPVITEAGRQAQVKQELAAWEQQASRPWREGDPRMPSEKRLGLPDEAPVEESLTAPSTIIPLLMPGGGAKVAAPLIAKMPAALGRLARPVAEGVSQTLGYGTGRTLETGEVPSAGDLGTTLGVTAGLGGVLEHAAPVLAKAGNVLRGVRKPADQALLDSAEKYGIRLSYGDVKQGAAAPKFEAALEAIPGSGAGRMRVRQQADVTQAGETIQTGLQTEMRQAPWRDLASVQQAARGTGPRAKEAQILLSEIADAGDDWGRVIQTSGKVNLFQDRLRAEQLYDRVEELAQPLGNMRLPNATKAIDDAIARASDDVLPSPEVKREVIGALSRIKGEISPTATQPQPSMGVRDPVTGTLRAEPVTQATNVPDTTYMRLRRLRSSLGDLQREAAEPATARYLSGVKTALEEDMATFAAKSNVPGLAKAGKEADTFYRTRIVPYREGQLAKAIKDGHPDEIYNQFVRRGKDRASYFYNGLDAKGQAAVRYGMIEEAIEKATSGKPDVFSPARFATSLKKIQDAHGVFFKGQPQWEINGITKLMQHAERAGQYMENPPTGLRGTIVGSVLTGSFLTSPWVAVSALLSAQGLRTTLMTQRGRNFLLAASDMQPGSSVFQKRLDAFLKTSPESAAFVGAARRGIQEEPQEAP